MFGIVVDGVMDVLCVCVEIKNIFCLLVMIIQCLENNLLKFVLNVDEVLQKIFLLFNVVFFFGLVVFDDVFDDICCYQMVMLVGVCVVFELLLVYFGLDWLEQEVDGGKCLVFGGKVKYWEKYCENFEGLIKNFDDCFWCLFGDEFVWVYEEQLVWLKLVWCNSV